MRMTLAVVYARPLPQQAGERPLVQQAPAVPTHWSAALRVRLLPST
jgi:hypothetical protein